MAKYSIYQVKKSNKTLASQSAFYGISDTFSQATARQAFAEGFYSHNADVEANSNIEVSKLVNTDRSSTKINALGPLRNVSVGDLINNTETGQWFIVSPTTYDPIKIKLR